MESLQQRPSSQGVDQAGLSYLPNLHLFSSLSAASQLTCSFSSVFVSPPFRSPVRVLPFLPEPQATREGSPADAFRSWGSSAPSSAGWSVSSWLSWMIPTLMSLQRHCVLHLLYLPPSPLCSPVPGVAACRRFQVSSGGLKIVMTSRSVARAAPVGVTSPVV